ncbi:MAG: helix-turn-helix domain-containing protein [Cyanobacteriota bacterium]|nr:helix-turn-helix domain-containing protein [Cyanobacteriota bacterium]
MAITQDHNLHFSPIIPKESDIELYRQTQSVLASRLKTNRQTHRFKIAEEDGNEQAIVIPADALQFVADILSQMAQGNAIALIPVRAELTIQEAADILNVSRPFVVKLIESGEIPCRKVGKHCRIRFADLMEYKQQSYIKQMQALDELAAQAQELNMGYE